MTTPDAPPTPTPPVTAPFARWTNGNYYAATKRKPYERVTVTLEFAFPESGAWGDAYAFARQLLRPGRCFVLQEVVPVDAEGEADGAVVSTTPLTTP